MRSPQKSLTCWKLATVAPLMFLAACGEGVSSSPDLPGHVFESVAVDSPDPEAALPEGTRIRLTFDGDSMSWVAACNHMGAAVRIGENTLAVDEDSVETTDMGCREDVHAQDDWLSEFFTSDPAWELDGRRLTLKSDSSRITFER